MCSTFVLTEINTVVVGKRTDDQGKTTSIVACKLETWSCQ